MRGGRFHFKSTDYSRGCEGKDNIDTCLNDL